jgi:hypothetical protein
VLILIICIVFSGCVEENNATQLNQSPYQDSVNLTPENQSTAALSSKEGNVPEIEVTSFSSIYTHNKNDKPISEKKYLYLFSWDNVPGNESQRLISYLKNDQDIGWVDNAQIVKINNNETIRVFTSENSLELTIGNNESTILLIIDSVPLCYLQIKKENSNICVYKVEEYKYRYNITEYYAVYNLSIKNNGSKNLDFKLNDLHVRYRDQIFNTTNEHEIQHLYRSEILSDLEIENKLEDTTLFPGQTINGSVVFRVSSLYNESFLLMYKETLISSASFDKSIKALSTAERYNYSVIFDLPPYYYDGDINSYEPDLEEYPYIWPNWINRSIFEFFNKDDPEDLAKSPIEDISEIQATYALKVIPERNITSILKKDTTQPYHKSYFIVIDDTGEELVNTSMIGKIAILKNQTYELHSGEDMGIPQMNFSNATVVIISYRDDYTWARLSFVDQDLILDDKMNIVIARNWAMNFIY